MDCLDATGAAMDSFQNKDIVGGVKTPGGLGSGSFKPTNLISQKEQRMAIANEVRVGYVKQRRAKLFQRIVQGHVTSWKDTVQKESCHGKIYGAGFQKD